MKRSVIVPLATSVFYSFLPAAADFGLAVFFDPDRLPRTDLGFDGTPWFMAPEVLSSQTYPASGEHLCGTHGDSRDCT